MSNQSFAQGGNVDYLESLYKDYKKEPSSVAQSWQYFFEGYDVAQNSNQILKNPNSSNDGAKGSNSAKVEALINAYRHLGHMFANINPLLDKKENPETNFEEFQDFKNIDPNEVFEPTNFGSKPLAFKEILNKLNQTYCSSIGADYRELNDVQEVLWIQERMEACQNKPSFTLDLKKRMLLKLCEAEYFETFLQTKYLGQKRFSAEGNEALLPLLDVLIDEAAKGGAKEACIGMAHRGRLSVLRNIMQKPLEKTLVEFEGRDPFTPYEIDGDVKYHQGFASEVKTYSGNSIKLYLSPNPSHLEIVNPLLEGLVRFRQEESADVKLVLPILIHGDAAFIGQGLVAETLNLSKLSGYQTGGTVHIIVNNQIGFTTNPKDGRSCNYSSDISKIIKAPVFHVNADHPEAVCWVAQLAFLYRQTFHKDVVIDLIGFRRHGHNETDEPSFTQPLMYEKINARGGVFGLYKKDLIAQGVLSEAEIEKLFEEVKKFYQEAFDRVKNTKDLSEFSKVHPPLCYKRLFAQSSPSREAVLAPVKTGVSKELLKEVAEKLTTIPTDFKAHPKIVRLVSTRRAMIDNQVDWALSELLAFGTLMKEGTSIRLSGQDCKRGTFSSRHAVLFDTTKDRELPLLDQVVPGKGVVINSPLSELGCLGFEFGYSIVCDNTLVLWEAQFGDFANGAQIVIDQFIVASEAKWHQTSSLVMLLPHGHEGMGPEHSSARPERFLQLCGGENITVCNVTTPAQYFHLLRRQMKRSFKKPLIVMSPKSLLRHPKVISPWKDFCEGRFLEILRDTQVKDSSKVETLLLCSGKIYFDLEEKRASDKKFENTAIVRLEQLYPFLDSEFLDIVKGYKKLKTIKWVQEEPKNMGYWTSVSESMREALKEKLPVVYVGRKSAGTTAEGSNKAHLVEQKRIVEEAFL